MADHTRPLAEIETGLGVGPVLVLPLPSCASSLAPHANPLVGAGGGEGGGGGEGSAFTPTSAMVSITLLLFLQRAEKDECGVHTHGGS